MKTNLLPYFLGVAILSQCCVAIADDFKDYDTNGDGVISKAEFEAHARRTAQTTAPSVDASTAIATPATKEKSGLIPWIEQNLEIRKSFFTDADSLDPAKISWTKAAHADA